MSWEYVEYEHPTSHFFHKMILWTNKNLNLYFALKLNANDSWIYYSGNVTNGLNTNKKLTYYTAEADAQTYYFSSVGERDSNGKILAVLPQLFQAKYVRMYVQSGGNATVYEFRPSTYFSANEIISGELLITDELSDAPLIRVVKSDIDRIKIGNIYGNTYGLSGADDSSATIFELSNTRTQIAGWDFNASQFTKNDTIISSNGKIRVGSGTDSVTMNSKDGSYRLWIGHSDSVSAPFRVTKEGKMFAEKVSITGTLDADYIRRGVLIATYIYINKISDLSGNLGNISAGDITGVTITGARFQTNTNASQITIDSDGISLHVTTDIGKYGQFKYGDLTNYGTGALAYIMHSAHRVPFYIAAEQDVADFHFYNRSAKPTGPAEVGDVCVVSGKHMICTSAGTPGTFVLVASQVMT